MDNELHSEDKTLLNYTQCVYVILQLYSDFIIPGIHPCLL